MVICFNKYSKIRVNILSFIICCFIFLIIFSVPKFISSKFSSKKNKEIIEISQESSEKQGEQSTENAETVENSLDENNSEKFNWYLKIPKIDLYAEVSSGIDSQTLNEYIGHFEESKKESGNVCLAAHNRGYNVNYFEKLKDLQNGDEIYYFVNGNSYKYVVDEIIIIYETDWSVIENTEEDRITLITCVENRPKYRLCVRGIREEN